MANPVSLGPFIRGIAGPPIVVPTGLANLELYLDAATDFSGIANGTAVSQWNDLSGKARHATQAVAASRPTVLNPGSPNGKPLVRWVPGDISPPGRFMTGTIPGAQFPTAARGYTFYVVGTFRKAIPNTFDLGVLWNALGDTAMMPISYDIGTGGGPSQNRWAAKAGALSEGTVVAGIHTFDGFVDPTTAVACYVYQAPNSLGDPAGAPTGGPIRLFRQGVEIAQALTPLQWRINTVALANYSVGSNDGVGSFCADMDLGALLWYSDSHSPAVVGHITRFLRRVYGV